MNTDPKLVDLEVKIDAAYEAHRNAVSLLEAAVAAVRKSASAILTNEARLFAARDGMGYAIERLSAAIASNRAGWSGGATNPTNINERVIAETASFILREYAQRNLHGQKN